MDTGKFIQTIQEHIDEGLTTGFEKLQPQLANHQAALKARQLDESRLEKGK